MIQLIAPKGYWYRKDPAKYGTIVRPIWLQSIVVTEAEKDKWKLVTEEEYREERASLNIKLPPIMQEIIDKLTKPKQPQ